MPYQYSQWLKMTKKYLIFFVRKTSFSLYKDYLTFEAHFLKITKIGNFAKNETFRPDFQTL